MIQATYWSQIVSSKGKNLGKYWIIKVYMYKVYIITYSFKLMFSVEKSFSLWKYVNWKTYFAIN